MQPVLCEASYVLLEYARTAMFMWMFIEGFFLHSMVTGEFNFLFLLSVFETREIMSTTKTWDDFDSHCSFISSFPRSIIFQRSNFTPGFFALNNQLSTTLYDELHNLILNFFDFYKFKVFYWLVEIFTAYFSTFMDSEFWIDRPHSFRENSISQTPFNLKKFLPLFLNFTRDKNV